MPSVTTAYIALGSNLGDRLDTIDEGVRRLLVATSAIGRRSHMYETEPVGYTDQPVFLNGVLEMTGDLPEPHDLLDLCLEIEAQLGRSRDVVNGPRTLDLDLLLFEGLVISDERLTLPHPRMHERLFVLKPLAELAPLLVHPSLGTTISQLLEKQTGAAGE